MTSQVPALRQKQGTIRAYLQKDDVKKQVQMALPKHLSADRLLRVAFTSISKNPKLLDCTTESLLGAIIQCAQLGLEPILGRAHLVPYKNRAKGVMEAQFQPGYQGLVDLIRRTGEVSDVWAEVIYDADTYKVTYGLHRDLIHEPNYKAPDRGQPVGAYAVIKYKDGTLGWTYMAVSEIYGKHRARSQAWKSAEQYKKYDSPWHTDEEPMLKKTVLKVHSKLAPMSIEAHTAAIVDDAIEIGMSAEDTWEGFLAAKGKLPDAEAVEVDTTTGEITEDAGTVEEFTQLAGQLEDTSKLDEFIKECATYGEVTPDEVRRMAVKRWDEFSSDYTKWLEKQEPPPVEEFVCQVEGCGFKAKSARGLQKHNTQQHVQKLPPEPEEPAAVEPEPETTEPEGEEPGEGEDFFTGAAARLEQLRLGCIDADKEYGFYNILLKNQCKTIAELIGLQNRQLVMETVNAIETFLAEG